MPLWQYLYTLDVLPVTNGQSTISWSPTGVILTPSYHGNQLHYRVGLTCAVVGVQGKGEGQLELKMTYFPFELLYSKPRDASLVRARSLLTHLPRAQVIGCYGSSVHPNQCP